MPRFCSHLTEQVDIFCKNVDNIMIFATHDMLYWSLWYISSTAERRAFYRVRTHCTALRNAFYCNLVSSDMVGKYDYSDTGLGSGISGSAISFMSVKLLIYLGREFRIGRECVSFYRFCMSIWARNLFSPGVNKFVLSLLFNIVYKYILFTGLVVKHYINITGLIFFCGFPKLNRQVNVKY